MNQQTEIKNSIFSNFNRIALWLDTNDYISRNESENEINQEQLWTLSYSIMAHGSKAQKL